MSKVVEWILDHRWAITPQALMAIIEVAERNVSVPIDPKIFHGQADFDVNEGDKKNLALIKQGLLLRNGERMEGTSSISVKGKVAVLSVFGPIFPRANIFTMLSGGSSITSMASDMQKALDAPNIESIILNVDSPGGEITDVEDFAAMIFSAQAKKRILTFVGGMGASAAYWIGSASSEMVLAKTSEVGSIGVVAAVRDTSVKDEKAGVKNINIVSSVSPKKRPDFKTEDGRADVQEAINALGFIFVDSVAKHRGTDTQDVTENFGRGSMFVAREAIKLGMADRLGSLEALIEEENQTINSHQGGYIMGKETLIKNGTVECVKEENPALYQSIIIIGKNEARDELEAQIKADAYQEGIQAENDRIKSCETLITEDTREVIEANKFDSEVTMDKMSSLILKDQKDKEEKAAKANKADANDLGFGTRDVDTGGGSGNSDDDCVSNMVAGGNDKRAQGGNNKK